MVKKYEKINCTKFWIFIVHWKCLGPTEAKKEFYTPLEAEI